MDMSFSVMEKERLPQGLLAALREQYDARSGEGEYEDEGEQIVKTLRLSGQRGRRAMAQRSSTELLAAK